MSDWEGRVRALQERRRSAVAAVSSEKEKIVEVEVVVADAEEAQVIVQSVAETVQRQAHAQIASIVSKCLDAIFDEPYEFKIDFEQKRGKTEAVLLFSRDGIDVDPLTASGGGVVDVAAFGLRLACLILSRPMKRRVLVLDEPFRFLSRDLRPRVRELLLTLAKEMKMQFVLVTHDEALTIGKIVELGG